MIDRKEESWQQLNIRKNGSYRGREILKDDEIDLMDLLMNMVQFTRRYKVWLITGPAFGLAVGILYFLMAKPLYKSEFVFEVSVLKRNELEQLIEELNTYIVEKNANIHRYDIDPLLVKEVGLVENEGESKSNTLSVVVTDPAYLPKLQASVVAYIGNNDFTKSELLAKKNTMLKTLEMLNAEEVKVDQVLNKMAGPEIVSGNENVHIADIFKLKIDIRKEKIKLRNELKQLESVTVIQDFPQYSEPYNRNFFIIISIGVAGGLFLALLFSGVKALRRMAYHHQRQNGVLRFNMEMYRE